MKKAMVIRELINKKGVSINAFAKEIDMRPSTLHSILERGAGRASVDNVIKICKGLGITCEELELKSKEEANLNDGGIKKFVAEVESPYGTIAAHHDGDNFTEEELESIELFKELIRQKKENKKT